MRGEGLGFGWRRRDGRTGRRRQRGARRCWGEGEVRGAAAGSESEGGPGGAGEGEGVETVRGRCRAGEGQWRAGWDRRSMRAGKAAR